jgi:hypothetical protein
MRKSELEIFRRALTLSDKYIHLAIYLGYLATDHGADPAEVDRLIRLATKDEIDSLLLERMKQGGLHNGNRHDK